MTASRSLSKEFLPGDIWFRLHDLTTHHSIKYISCRNMIKVNERNFLEAKKKKTRFMRLIH